MRIQSVVFVLGLLSLLVLSACTREENAEGSKPRLDPSSPAGQGQILFRTNCATCHAVEGNRVIVGPALTGIAVRAATRIADLNAEDYIRQSILNPNAYIVEGFPSGSMPQNFARDLTSEELENIVAYLLTLE